MRSKFNNHSFTLMMAFMSLIVPLRSFGQGNEVGNGGTAVTCKNKSPRMLDLYEAEVLRKAKFDSKLNEKDAFKSAKLKLELLARVDPKLSKILLANLERIQKDISFEDQITLRPVDDSLHAFVPADKNCKVEQLAVLRKKPMLDEKRILVNQTVFKKMQTLDQTALILHETVYEYFAVLGEKDSTKSRYLVSYLLGQGFAKTSEDEYWAMIKSLRIPVYR